MSQKTETVLEDITRVHLPLIVSRDLLLHAFVCVSEAVDGVVENVTVVVDINGEWLTFVAANCRLRARSSHICRILRVTKCETSLLVFCDLDTSKSYDLADDSPADFSQCPLNL